jgi:hypothetical protein
MVGKAAIEGGTEATQQVLQNAVPAAYQGDASGLLEGVPKAAGIGAIVGGGTGGTAAAVSQTGIRAAAPITEPAPSLAPEQAAPLPDVPPAAESPAEAATARPSPTPAPTRLRLGRGGPWSTPLIDRVERQGGSVGVEIADKARLASDTAGALRGKWQVLTKPLRKSLSGNTLGERRTRKELNQRTEIVAQDTSGQLASYGYSRFQDAVENDEALATLSPRAQDTVRSFRDFIRRTAEDIGTVTTPDGGPILMQTEEGLIPFRGAEGGKRLIRQWTPEMWEVMQSGDQSPAYRALGQALAEIPENGLTEDVALEALNGIRQQVVEKRSAVEVARTFKKFPSYIKLRDGTEVPILQTDPMQASESITQNLALRTGYISQFGQNFSGASVGEQLRESFVRSGGNQKDVDMTMRALQGMPTEDPLAQPGEAAHKALRVYDTAKQVGGSALLTRSFIPNITESFAKTPVAGGIRNAAKASAQMARMMVDPKYRREALEDIESRGWHTVEVMDWMLTPGREMESAGRMVGQVLTAPARVVNELNDMHAALTARNWLGRLEAGKGGPMDKARLEILQFSPEQIDAVMAGNPTPETAPLFNAVGRRLVSYAQGSTSLPAELSRAGNSRNYNRIIQFDRYAQFTANRLSRQVLAVIDAKTPAAKARQARLLAQLLGGSAISGVGAKLLTAALMDGFEGVEDVVRGATAGDDDREKAKSFAEFIGDATRYTLLGGAADAGARSLEASSGARAAENIVRSTVPGRYFLDLKDFYGGSGVYKNLDTGDAVLRWLERNAPIAPVFRQVMAETGLGHKNIQREVAIRRAWQFMRENEGVGSSTPPENGEPAEDKAFRQTMKKVEMALREGRSADAARLRRDVVKAAAKSGMNPRASLQGKRIIPQIDKKNRAEARKWMGEKNWRALEQYDALLTQYAQTFPAGGK